MALDAILEQTGGRPGRAAARRKKRAVRVNSGWLQRWARSRITALRAGQTALYIGVVYFGISALIAGIPTFDIAAPNGWTPIWASILIFGGIVASIGSTSEHDAFEIIEFVGVVFIFLTVATYAAVLLGLAYGEGDDARAAVGSGFVVLSLPPGVRMIWFMLQIRRWISNSRGRRTASQVATTNPGE